MNDLIFRDRKRDWERLREIAYSKCIEKIVEGYIGIILLLTFKVYFFFLQNKKIKNKTPNNLIQNFFSIYLGEILFINGFILICDLGFSPAHVGFLQ